jgi:ATP-dependent helicase/nuclease subunit B
MQLTSNRRMAVFLEQKILRNDSFQQPVQDKQRVLPLNVWLEQLYAELSANETGLPTLLNEREEEVIWEQIIQRSEAGQFLLKTSGAARLACEAWRLMHEWQITHFDGYQTSTDLDTYIGWAGEYKKICLNNNWIDYSHCVNLISQWIGEKKISLPTDIELFGFEELSPQLRYLLNRMTEVGLSVRLHSLVSLKGKGFYLEASDLEDELRLAAHQAKAWLSAEPQSSIAVVIPDLQKRRAQVVRIFEEVWPKDKFNVAAPIPLTEYPLIDAALLALSFLKEPLPLEKFSQFLRSPFFGGIGAERLPRVALDIMLRRSNNATLSFEQILLKVEQEIQCESTAACPQLFIALRALVAKRPHQWVKQSAQAWSDCFTLLLNNLGWPGDRTLNVEEVQVRQQWDQLLADYVRMGRVLGEHSYSEALLRLTRIAAATSFLPRSEQVSVQVLGLLEAAGIPFDYLWITGMHREAWPLEPSPNPFIPLSLQRTLDMPRSSAQRELKMAKLFTERFLQGAKEIIFSYPKMQEDRICTISPLLIEKEVKKGVKSQMTTSYHLRLDPFTRVDSFIPLQPGEKISGGTRLLKLQAACSFRAFAEIRLQATPLPIAQVGLSNAERGEIIHQVLECFWQDLPNQTALKLLTEEEETLRARTCINKVLKQWQTRRPNSLTPKYMALEEKRVLNLILRYIELEKTRPMFEVIAREQEEIVELAGIKMKIRIDRVDRLESGEEILIDYKTGNTTIRDWFSKRPPEPQLPLYCVTRTPAPVGMVFGIVRPDNVKYQGLARESNLLPGVKTLSKVNIEGSGATWEEQRASWRSVLETLAKDFSEGVATIDPVEGGNTCRHCNLQSICRVKEHIQNITKPVET